MHTIFRCLQIILHFIDNLIIVPPTPTTTILATAEGNFGGDLLGDLHLNKLLIIILSAEICSRMRPPSAKGRLSIMVEQEAGLKAKCK